MSEFVVRLVISALALVAAVEFVPGIELDWRNDPVTLVAVALIFGVVNAYLRPIVRLLALPISLVTLGLIGIVINVGLLLLVGYVSGELGLGFTIAGWPRGAFGLDTIGSALLASLVISAVSTALGLVARGRGLVGL